MGNTEMNDFAKSLEAKSDQINNTDLAGEPQTIKITRVNVNIREDQPVSISFEGSDKVYRPCKGMRIAIAEVWGRDHTAFIGRSLTLYRDPDVRFGADTTGGTRISHMSHITVPKKVTVKVSRGKFKTYTVQPLQVAPSAPDNAIHLAESAARRGSDAFRSWWGSDEGKACRSVANANIDALKSMATEADAAGIDVEDDDGAPM